MTELDDRAQAHSAMFEGLGEERVRSMHAENIMSVYRPYAIAWLAHKADLRRRQEDDRNERSVRAAERAARWGAVSGVISVLALIVSIVALVKSG